MNAVEALARRVSQLTTLIHDRRLTAPAEAFNVLYEV
jgi:hypothetical protein